MKKLLSSILLCASLLIPSSAFAASGYADTKATAVELNQSSEAGSYLDYQDTDWYKYTNISGRRIEISFILQPKVSFINYDIRAHYPNGDIITAPDQGPGLKDVVYDVVLQPGETVYLQIFGHTIRDFGNDAQYRIYYVINP